MNLSLNTSLASNYHSGTQKARVLTEHWVVDNMYCPRCGNFNVKHFPNNSPVADFYCQRCKSEYELKSKYGSIAKKITDGAYYTMIERITSYKNPDFLFMNYSKDKYFVKDLMLIPKHFFVPEVIEKRKPLSETAKRAGWVGCNILFNKIPNQGRIYLIKNGEEIDKTSVFKKVAESKKLEFNDMHARGWVFDILNCVNQISSNVFSLDDVYSYSNYLALKHPQNNNIKPKIRQQLQVLRDLNFIKFLGQGKYMKV